MKLFLFKLLWRIKLLLGIYSSEQLTRGSDKVPIVFILEEAKELVASYQVYGMCKAIGVVLDAYKIDSYYHPLKYYIPLFNYDQAKYLFKESIGESGVGNYWWSPNDIDTRLKYFDWLINHYKNA